MGKPARKFGSDDEFINLASAVVEEQHGDDAYYVKVYIPLEEKDKLAEALENVTDNRLKLELHIRERKGPRGKFLSGFMFAKETDPDAFKKFNKGGKVLKGFKRKQTDKTGKGKFSSRLKRRIAAARGSEEE